MLENLSIEIPQKEIVAFCRRHQIRRLAIFGSALRQPIAFLKRSKCFILRFHGRKS